jgi:hypothetical protein
MWRSDYHHVGKGADDLTETSEAKILLSVLHRLLRRLTFRPCRGAKDASIEAKLLEPLKSFIGQFSANSMLISTVDRCLARGSTSATE